MDTDFLDWALADFSGYVAADELYDGPFCILSAVDNRCYKRILYDVLDHDPTHDDIRQPCPRCGHAAYRDKQSHRTLHDLGNLDVWCPRDLVVTYSQHYCTKCHKYFQADLSDLAPPGSQYTHRVIDLAVRLVVEDGVPYRPASWHLWRDHRVFVPFATIQNWVEALSLIHI